MTTKTADDFARALIFAYDAYGVDGPVDWLHAGLRAIVDDLPHTASPTWSEGIECLRASLPADSAGTPQADARMKAMEATIARVNAYIDSSPERRADFDAWLLDEWIDAQEAK